MEHFRGHPLVRYSIPHHSKDADATEAKDFDSLCLMPRCLQRKYLMVQFPEYQRWSDHVRILTAVLNRYYNFANPNSVQYLIWYIGEVSTAVYVVNAPACWPLLRKLLPNWLSTTHNASTGATDRSSGRIQSAYQGSAPRGLPAMPSESEENLAMHNLYRQFSEEDGKTENELNHGRYRTEITGDCYHERTAPGILKTVDFKVLKK